MAMECVRPATVAPSICGAGAVSRLAAIALVWCALLLSAGAARAADAEAEPAAPTHRSLRDTIPPNFPEAAEPHDFQGYAGAPPFSVVPQVDTLTFYPCSSCHNAALKQNPTPRKLDVPHPAAIPHANGRFWCLACHQEKDIDHLHTLSGAPVDFNESYKVCGQCHFNRQKDWYFGAHGKRVANWRGERVIYNCTHCHNPHQPGVPALEPQKPPPVRAGLHPMALANASAAARVSAISAAPAASSTVAPPGAAPAAAPSESRQEPKP